MSPLVQLFKLKIKEKNINLSHFFKIKNKIELPFVFIGGINHGNIKSLKNLVRITLQ